MDFPGNILDRVSRIFKDDSDDILIYALVFLFVFLAGQPDGRLPDESPRMGGSLTVIIIAVFLILFLLFGGRDDPSA